MNFCKGAKFMIHDFAYEIVSDIPNSEDKPIKLIETDIRGRCCKLECTLSELKGLEKEGALYAVTETSKVENVQPKACVCTSRDLFNFGCKCGGV